MKNVFYVLLLLNFLGYSQITSIPDSEFEQALIDLNIDSDGIINGQVLTSDIDNVEDLNLALNSGSYSINDLTGLQDFAQLKNLRIDNLYLSNNDLSLDLTANTLLESLIMIGGDDAFTHDIEKIDLSENPNINLIQTTGIWTLKQLNLKTGATDVSNLNIDISVNPNNLQGDSHENLNDSQFCIKVSDEDAATNRTGVYNTWTITANNNPYYFSETCVLNIEQFNQELVNIYPNPTSEFINIEVNNIKFDAIKIFNLQGQLVKVFNNLDKETIDVSDLKNGLYFMALKSDQGDVIKKFIKQ
ncbi:MAG: T9SS type A sorting domain-containing protein [Flavobacteriaceae bacterium]|nr:T9SS type A sorting domain-containing protein [Psychroflexus sp.]